MNTLNGNATINPNAPIKCTKDGLIEQLKKMQTNKWGVKNPMRFLKLIWLEWPLYK